MKNLILAFICLLLAIPCQARIIFVDANTPDNNDGSSWAKAYKYLQDALTDANSAGDVNEIRVAQGIYTPDSNSADPNGSGDREATFQLINGVAIKGGFAGFGQPDPNARDIEPYETILSGDLLDNDDPCTPVEDLLDDPCRSDNSYHLFCHPSGVDLNASAILDGFIITAGNANGSETNRVGAGMYNPDNSNPTITNCTFSRNSADYSGGGMYNRENSATVTNCTFSGNSGRWGAGMGNWNNSSATVTNCTFSGNSAYCGGGMYSGTASPTVTNCTFSGNSAGWYGGGIYNAASSPTVMDCTFSANSADDGGGMTNGGVGGSNPVVERCSFSGNLANGGGGMHNTSDSCPTVTNCTFTGNSAGDGGGMQTTAAARP